MLKYQEIKDIYNRFHRKDDGAINDIELQFLQNLIEGHRPKIFVEIGVASGMSSGFIARFMGENEGQVLHSIDINERYYADETKPVGYLIPEIYAGSPVNLILHTKKSAFDLREILGNTKFDMAFIDANHAHPWPTIDTMLLLPFAMSRSLLVHHDLSLYKKQEVKKGIGPKYLFDQFNSDEKEIIPNLDENIGYFKAPEADYKLYEGRMINSLMRPWTVDIHPYFVERFKNFLREYWSSKSLNAFEEGLAQHRS